MAFITKSQLEAKVVRAVDEVIRGGKVEDDLFECKKTWPNPAKAARQLAGSANRAAGDLVVWIIGLDENAHQLSVLDSTDPANWLSQVQSQFHRDVYPDTVFNIGVPIDENGYVVTLAFDTARSPYVIRSPYDANYLEVPMRDGARTRSAYRDDLLRILEPRTRVPNVVVLDASMKFAFNESDGKLGGGYFAGLVELFIEHLASTFSMMPAHKMSATLKSPNRTFPVQIELKPDPSIINTSKGNVAAPPPPTHGVSVRQDGILVTGPGGVKIGLLAHFDSIEDGISVVNTSPQFRLDMELGVLNAAQPITLRLLLDQQPTTTSEFGGLRSTTTRWEVGSG